VFQDNLHRITKLLTALCRKQSTNITVLLPKQMQITSYSDGTETIAGLIANSSYIVQVTDHCGNSNPVQISIGQLIKLNVTYLCSALHEATFVMQRFFLISVQQELRNATLTKIGREWMYNSLHISASYSALPQTCNYLRANSRKKKPTEK
jgi:hypothetical protein